MGKNPTKAPKEQPSYDIRDVVLAKVRGFPPWPGMVVDPDFVPSGVTKERPTSKKTTFYCVRFFPAGDYAWLVAKDISKLQTHEIQSYIAEPFKRSGELLKGYQIALDPKKWEDETAARLAAGDEEEANAEVDQLEESENEHGDDGGETTKKSGKSKKRKRESEPAGEKKALKAKAPKSRKDSSEPATGEKKGKKGSASAGAKGGKKKSKATVESEDDADHAEDEGEDDDAGPSKKASPPPAKKSKKEKDEEGEVDAAIANDPEAIKVREWRHKLQKAFLSTKNLPKEEDMPALDQLFQSVEQYDKICIQYLTFSKIGKVMRHIAQLSIDKVPRDDEFRFRDRAQVLVNKWHEILHDKPNGSEASAGGNKESKTNGTTTVKDDGVVDGTAAIDLNGKKDAPADEPVNGVAEGDSSILADVTMSEVA